MIGERKITREKRLAEEANYKLLERLIKFVVYNRFIDDRQKLSSKLINVHIHETVVYNDKEYVMDTILGAEDVLLIMRETSKK